MESDIMCMLYYNMLLHFLMFCQQQFNLQSLTNKTPLKITYNGTEIKYIRKNVSILDITFRANFEMICYTLGKVEK